MIQNDEKKKDSTRDVDLTSMAFTMNTEISVFHEATDRLKTDLLHKADELNGQVNNLDNEIEQLIDKRRNYILTLDIVNATITMIDNKVKI